MSRALLLAGVMLALGVSSASAHTTIIAPPEAHWPYQQWVEESVPTPPVTVEVIESATCDGGPALACAEPTQIWIAT